MAIDKTVNGNSVSLATENNIKWLASKQFMELNRVK